MSELPEGWVNAPIAGLISPEGLFSDGDWVESKDQDPNGSNRLLQLADIGDGVFLDKSSRFVNDQKFDALNCTEVKHMDVLVARMPDPLGRACLMPSLPQRCITVVDVAVIRPGINSVIPRWLMHTLNAPIIRETIELLSTGTTRRRISRGNLAQIEIPIPPIEEQKRIADKLDQLLARVDACRDRLDRIPVFLKSFRQAVLAAATSGQLTEDWRESVGCASRTLTNQETAIGIIKRLKKTRLLSAKRQSDIEKVDRFFTENLIYHGNNIDVPESWVTCQIGAIGDVSNGSTPSRKNSEYWNGDINWVSSGEVRNNLIFETKERISKEGYKNTSVQLLPKGSVLIAMIGEGKTRGQSSILKIQACINQNIAAVVINQEYICPEYLWYWFQAKYEENRTIGSGTGPQALNCQRVRELPFSFPAIEEQQEIIRRVEKLFAYADRLEARYRQARAEVDRLAPALLAKAFRGELVPQDPDDEPASALLERLRAERASAGTGSKPRKPRGAGPARPA